MVIEKLTRKQKNLTDIDELHSHLVGGGSRVGTNQIA